MSDQLTDDFLQFNKIILYKSQWCYYQFIFNYFVHFCSWPDFFVILVTSSIVAEKSLNCDTINFVFIYFLLLRSCYNYYPPPPPSQTIQLTINLLMCNMTSFIVKNMSDTKMTSSNTALHPDWYGCCAVNVCAILKNIFYFQDRLICYFVLIFVYMVRCRRLMRVSLPGVERK